MFKIFSIVCLFTVCFTVSAETLADRIDALIPALIAVESNGNSHAIGDNGKAKGALQLHRIYIIDVNTRYRTNFTHDDAFDVEKAKKIVKLYLLHYGKRYERLTKKTATYEILARIHNGGPNGYKKPQTVKYWNKVKKHLK